MNLKEFFNLARIIGKLNIYHDDLFPFNVESMIEWDKREKRFE